MSAQNPIFPSRDDRGRLSEEQMLAYLEGRLSVEEARMVEEWLAEEGAEADAMEGLAEVSAEEVKQMSLHLKGELHRQLRAKSRVKRRGYDGRGAWMAILVVLLLALVGYAVLYLLRKP